MSKDDDQPESQTLADQKCKSRGAELASISSIRENAFVAKETSANARQKYWIGLVYDITSSTFSWRYGPPVVSFTRWARYEPELLRGECVTFGFDGNGFTWSVSNCSTKAGYICESEFVGSRKLHLTTMLFLGMLANSSVGLKSTSFPIC